MRRIKSLHVMSEVITKVEMRMTVVHATQKFPWEIIFTCFRLNHIYCTLSRISLPRRHPDHEENHGHH